MNTATAEVQTHLHPSYVLGEKLGAEITELYGYISAATYQLLVLIREFDENKCWELPGLTCCAHWLNFKCGIGMNAAREKVRVAHALKSLPKISEAFAAGELSYSKARAMTRIADESNEDYLLMIARHGTAYHVEKLVSSYRRCKRLQQTDTANEQHRRRELNYRYDENGCLEITGRFPPEQGALILKALEIGMNNQDVSAETSEQTEPRESFSVRRADALGRMAEHYLNSDTEVTTKAASTADRYQVVVHVSAETLQDDVSAETSAHINAEISHIEDGPHVSAETSRRIACDCSMLRLVEDDEGEPLSIGRKSRSIPPAIRRALRFRDEGCRFPGCTRKHFIDGHHIKHWADGGETSLDNLVQLCRHHHRLVHEGGFDCRRLDDGEIVFLDKRQAVLPDFIRNSADLDARKTNHWMRSTYAHLNINEQTCVTRLTAGEHIDWDLAVGHLFLAETAQLSRL